MKEIGCKSAWTVHISPLSWAIERLLPGETVKICPRPAEFSLRFFKSDRLLANYTKGLEQLGNAVATSQQRPLSDLEKQGLIQAFEFTHELAWNVMKDYFAYQGNPDITDSRDAAREAFRLGLVEDGEGWMEMIKSRNQTSHTYQQKVADEIAGYIVERYFPLFQRFLLRMNSIKA